MTQHQLRATFETFDDPISADFRQTLRAKLLADLAKADPIASTPQLDIAEGGVDESEEIIVLKETDRSQRSPHRTRALVGAAAVVIIALGVGAVLISRHDSDTNPRVVTAPAQHLRGTYTLVDDGINGSGTDCHGTGAYNDFRSGLDATFRDADGNVVGAGKLRNMTEADMAWLIEDDTRTAFLSNPMFRTELFEGSPVNTMTDATDRATRVRVLLGIDDFRAGRKCTFVFDIAVEPAASYELAVGPEGSTTYAAADQTYTAQALTDAANFINVVRGS